MNVSGAFFRTLNDILRTIQQISPTMNAKRDHDDAEGNNNHHSPGGGIRKGSGDGIGGFPVANRHGSMGVNSPSTDEINFKVY